MASFTNQGSAAIRFSVDVPLNGLSDVNTSNPSENELLVFDGSNIIVNKPFADLGISAVGHTHSATDITSGIFSVDRIPEAAVTQHQAALAITASQITDLDLGSFQPLNTRLTEVSGLGDASMDIFIGWDDTAKSIAYLDATKILSVIDTAVGNSDWQTGPIGGDGTTNLSNSRSASSVTIISSTGTNTSVPAVSATLAGAMTAADKVKLDAIETEATADQSGSEIVDAINNELSSTSWQGGGAGSTDLNLTRDGTTVTVASSTGNDAVIPAATAFLAGALIAADKSKLDGVEANSTADQSDAEIVTAVNTQLGGTTWQTGVTNLTFSLDATTVTVESSAGTNAALPTATATDAGVMAAADKVKIDDLPSGTPQDPSTNPLTAAALGDLFVFIDISAAAGSEAATITKQNFQIDVVDPRIAVSSVKAHADFQNVTYTDGQVPIWNDANSEFRPGTPAGGGGGGSVTPYDLGTITTGTITPNFSNGTHQYGENNGAFTLAPPTGYGSMFLELTNQASAGAVSVPDYDLVEGTYNTTVNKRVHGEIVKHQNTTSLRWRVMDTDFAPPVGVRRMSLQVPQAVPASSTLVLTEGAIGGAHEFWDEVQTDGGDIRVYTDNTYTTRLPCEVRTINTVNGSEELELYVRVPAAMVTNDTIVITYGAATTLSQPAVDAAFGVEEVWTDHTRASHDILAELTGNGTRTANGTVAATGPYGGLARDFDSVADSTDSVDHNFSAVPDELVFSALINQRLYSNDLMIFGNQTSGFRVQMWSGGEIYVENNFTGGARRWRTTGGTWALNEWAHICVYVDRTNLTAEPKVYRNGVLLSSTPIVSTGALPAVSSGDFHNSAVNFAVLTWDGLQAEDRFRDVVGQTALITAIDDYAAAQSSNLLDPDNFFTVGAGEAG